MKDSKQPKEFDQSNNHGVISYGSNNTIYQTNIDHPSYTSQINQYWNCNAAKEDPPRVQFWKEVRNAIIKATISSLLTLPWSAELGKIVPVLKTVDPIWITIMLWLALYGFFTLYVMIYRYREKRVFSAVFFLITIAIGLAILANFLKNYAVILDIIVIICVFSLIIADVIQLIKKGIRANKCRIKKEKTTKKAGKGSQMKKAADPIVGEEE